MKTPTPPTRLRGPAGALLACLLTAAAAPPALALPQEIDARPLFLEHCSPCHGERGDGQGVTELDRRARSFVDGGFSFGDTPEAIGRTLRSGIPGTPMPSFSGTVSEAQLDALAQYVISLGPERREVGAHETRLEVRERPQIVRGMLPPIVEGAPARPRGLLVGTPDGLTFEWRTDDVRLLGIRQGGFVDRKDWTGRGGSPLEPLGQVVYTFDQGDPAPAFERIVETDLSRNAQGFTAHGPKREPLAAQLTGTFVRGGEAGLIYRLETPDGDRVATVEDSLSALGTSVGSGFRRRVAVTGGELDGTVAMRAAARSPLQVLTFTSPQNATSPGPRLWRVTKLPNGLFQCAAMHLDLSQGGAMAAGMGADVWFDCSSGRSSVAQVSVVLTTEWNAEVRTALEKEVQL